MCSLAFICPDKLQVVVVEEGNIQLDLDIPDNEGVNPDDAVTSEGVNLLPSDSFEVTSPADDTTFRVMDVEFIVLGAETVTVTFTRPGEPDEVIEVRLIHYNVLNFILNLYVCMALGFPVVYFNQILFS